MADSLILKRALASRQSGEWNDDDFDVLADGAVVGRILRSAAKPPDRQWMWTLAYGYHEDRTPTHGYEPTREAADGRVREELAALWYWQRFDGIGGIVIDLGLMVALLSLTVSCLAYWHSRKTAERTEKAAILSQRLEAVNHIRTAMDDTHRHANITRKTTDSIREAKHLSDAVFDRSIAQTIDRALTISLRIQHIPSERQDDQYDRDEVNLKYCLDEALRLMKKESALAE